jgi:hypothetical protein
MPDRKLSSEYVQVYTGRAGRPFYTAKYGSADSDWKISLIPGSFEFSGSAPEYRQEKY